MGWFKKDTPVEDSKKMDNEELGAGVVTLGSGFTSRNAQHLKDASNTQPSSASSTRANK